jgi:putative endonuclease
MHYTYVLLSQKDGRWYTGAAGDLRKRLREHATGNVRSTASRAPLELIYYEACMERDDALRRERFLKTGKGKRYLENRLGRFLLNRRSKSRSSSPQPTTLNGQQLERDKLERH